MIANDLHDVNSQILIHGVFKRCNQRNSHTWYIYVLADTRIMLQESKHIFDAYRTIPKTRIRICVQVQVSSAIFRSMQRNPKGYRIPFSGFRILTSGFRILTSGFRVCTSGLHNRSERCIPIKLLVTTFDNSNSYWNCHFMPIN